MRSHGYRISQRCDVFATHAAHLACAVVVAVIGRSQTMVLQRMRTTEKVYKKGAFSQAQAVLVLHARTGELEELSVAVLSAFAGSKSHGDQRLNSPFADD